MVKRALERTHAIDQPAPDERVRTEGELDRAARVELEQRIAHAEDALRHAEERHRSAIAEAVARAAEQQAEYAIGLARAAATREMLDEQLREAGDLVARSRRDQGAAAADVDRLSRRETELSALLADATAERLALQERLAGAEAAVAAAAVHGADELRHTANQFAERQRDLEGRIAGEIEKRDRVEKNLAQAERERHAADERHADAIADAINRRHELELALGEARREVESRAGDVERLVGREAALTTTLAAAAASHADLEGRLAAAEQAFRDAADREARERAAAARQAEAREAELGARIESERAARERLELAIADASATLQDTQRRYEAALAVAAQERRLERRSSVASWQKRRPRATASHGSCATPSSISSRSSVTPGPPPPRSSG